VKEGRYPFANLRLGHDGFDLEQASGFLQASEVSIEKERAGRGAFHSNGSEGSLATP
jgi:hypothetical protein